MVEMDVLDPDAARSYIEEQARIEEKNGLLSYEYFADDIENPSKVVLLATYESDAVHVAHHANIRAEEFMAAFTNLTLRVFGNPPPAVIDRMEESGYPATGRLPYFMGFHGAL